jgi:hypothetical protein
LTTELGRGGRVAAACLAAVWTAAGLAAVILGIAVRPGVLPVVLGLLAMAYGGIWLRVAVTGRRVRWERSRRA